ncbi:MAG: hypothetical protein QXE82_00210 [Candidatus Nitrosotenuis sp.]
MQKNEETTELVMAGPLTPVFADPKIVRENIKKFREYQKQLLDPEVDIEYIQGKPFTKKSGWNVIDGFFGCVTRPIDSWKKELPDGEFMMVVVVEASGMGRKPVSRSGYCSSIEMKKKHHDKDYAAIESHCHSMAETRAVGRASAAFFMVEDVSAEEVGDSPGFSDQDATIPKGVKRACKCNEATKNANLVKPGGTCPVCNGVRF